MKAVNDFYKRVTDSHLNMRFQAGIIVLWLNTTNLKF